ncbi:MAG: 5-formyltetrahydrofolate cyclo-ligase [Acetobacteraceae bacterium]
MTPLTRAWEDVRSWRRDTRTALLERRMAASPGQRAAWGARIESHLGPLLRGLPGRTIGFYWPFKGEFDARALVTQLLATAPWRAGLPVVSARNAPLLFRPWVPGCEMESGVLGIPVPKSPAALVPDILLAPLVGFDAANYRLGYGGGYFDRTLAALSPRPQAIGVGFEISRLDSVYPQPHDIPMDFIVTEAGVQPGGSARPRL